VKGKKANGGGSQQSCTVSDTVYPALLPLMRTRRLPAADWTDTPADKNGLVRFAGKPNLVSARVPSHSVSALTFCFRRPHYTPPTHNALLLECVRPYPNSLSSFIFGLRWKVCLLGCSPLSAVNLASHTQSSLYPTLPTITKGSFDGSRQWNLWQMAVNSPCLRAPIPLPGVPKMLGYCNICHMLK